MRDDMNLKPDSDTTVLPILDAAQHAAFELRQLRDRLSYDTRHSFRTPLTVIDGTARRLARNAETLSPEEVRQRVHTIRATVEKMVDIVERSIEMSELASCVYDAPRTSDLADMVERLVKEHRQGNAGLRLVAWTEDCSDLEVVDRRLMELILDKLLVLGTEIIQDRGRLDFVCWSDGASTHLSLKAVFESRSPIDVKELSYRLGEDDQERLTLLCKGMEIKLIRLLIEQHGGELEIDMDEDRVEFEIQLPIDSTQQAPTSSLISAKNNKNTR